MSGGADRVDASNTPAYMVVDDERHPWFESINDEGFPPSPS